MKENLQRRPKARPRLRRIEGRSQQGNWDHLAGQEVVDKHPRLIVDFTY